MTPVQLGVARLVKFYETLSPDTLAMLDACYAPMAQFKDPFNDVQGVEKIRQVFAHMFVTVEDPRFVVTDGVVQGNKAFLQWKFYFRMRRWRAGVEQCIEGGTWLHLNQDGLVLVHRDYWDTAEELYEKLPVLGGLMRYLRRAGSATSPSSSS